MVDQHDMAGFAEPDRLGIGRKELFCIDDSVDHADRLRKEQEEKDRREREEAARTQRRQDSEREQAAREPREQDPRPVRPQLLMAALLR